MGVLTAGRSALRERAVPVTEICWGEPDLVLVRVDEGGGWTSAEDSATSVLLTRVGSGLRVDIACSAVLSRVMLRWRRETAAGVVILGDAWERSYGEMQWRGLQPERVLPWMAVVHHRETGANWGVGVEVRAGAFAGWTIDTEGVSLWLDVRAGGAPVRLGDRVLTAVVVRAVETVGSAFACQSELAGALCRDPLPVGPLVGANNWYYAYGKGFDAGAVLRDARTIAELVGDHPVRPFGVVDDGWTPEGVADGRIASAGPWDAGRATEFPDMEAVASSIAALDVRPGIWFRPLLRRTRPDQGALGPRDGAIALDPSSPATLATVAEDVSRIVGWGFELIKHDFSTYDLLGQWGPHFGASPGRSGWRLADDGITTAEALVNLYRTIRAAAGPAIVLGCNVVGHLAAGLVEAQRTGDDTSGRVWEQTRRTGVNTLAFRLAQHRRFFAVDADCVPSTTSTDWALNRQFLDLIARSGTALFVSVDPRTRTDQVDADLSAALRLALNGGDPGGVEPLDWLDTTSPERWATQHEQLRYTWMERWGADPFEQFQQG